MTGKMEFQPRKLMLPWLYHLRCAECGARFFDDEAMHRIQSERAKASLARAV